MRQFIQWTARYPHSDAGGAQSPAVVQMSQQRLDQLIGRAFSKGARRAAQMAEDEGRAGQDPGTLFEAPASSGENTGDSVIFSPTEAGGPDSEPAKAAGAASAGESPTSAPLPQAEAPQNEGALALAAAQRTLDEANRRLLAAMVAQQAPAARLSPRGAEAALRLWDFQPLLEQGAPKEEDVRQRLEQFAQSWPEFSAAPGTAPFAAGTGSDAISHDALKNALGVL